VGKVFGAPRVAKIVCFDAMMLPLTCEFESDWNFRKASVKAARINSLNGTFLGRATAFRLLTGAFPENKELISGDFP
jgi:hypothetical protein